MGSETSPLRWIRRNVFRVRQDEMAPIAGVSRPRISRYETGDPPPYEVMARIRAEARDRGLKFDADWFFEIPSDQAEAA